jgi:arylsulfatase A
MWPLNGKHWPILNLFQDNQPVEEVKNLGDQALLTEKYTKEAIGFIDKNKLKPFMLYLSHSMPHVPIAAGARFAGKSKKGLYADTIQEIDWSVGEVLRTLKRNKLDRNTLVIFSSDNGPWRPYGNHAGSPGGFREGKGTTFEAGMRVPGIFWQPGTVRADTVCDKVVSTMDVLPTIAKMAGVPPPKKVIDGHNLTPLLASPDTEPSPWKWYLYFWPGELQAVRSGNWKLHVPHKHRRQTVPAGLDGKSAGEAEAEIGLSLFDLAEDPGETNNVADQHPEIVARLMKMIKLGRNELGDTGTGTKGSGSRPPGTVVK